LRKLNSALLDIVKMSDYVKRADLFECITNDYLLILVKNALIKFLNAMPTQMDDSHNMVHINKVMNHTIRAIQADETITAKQELALIIGALLHEIDDHKYFKPSGRDGLIGKYWNAYILMRELGLNDELISDVLNIIRLVGCSENKNRKYEGIPDWMYIVRDADRLEGVEMERCITYSREIGQPAFIDTTIRATGETDAEMLRDLRANIATPARFEAYGGKSVSVIDHIADKLLHILAFSSNNAYLNDAKRGQQEQLEAVYLEFSRVGAITFERIYEIIA
jgi:hypothetical protein